MLGTAKEQSGYHMANARMWSLRHWGWFQTLANGTLLRSALSVSRVVAAAQLHCMATIISSLRNLQFFHRRLQTVAERLTYQAFILQTVSTTQAGSDILNWDWLIFSANKATSGSEAQCQTQLYFSLWPPSLTDTSPLLYLYGASSFFGVCLCVRLP